MTILRHAGAAALDWLFPPACLVCAEPAGAQGGLCAACWREMRWIAGPSCDACAAPLGFDIPDIEAMALGPPHCAACSAAPRPWRRGRAVCLYDGSGRKLVLALKHGDRLDAARPMGAWLARAGAELLAPSDRRPPPLITPAPLHWTRRLGRRFNQALELARFAARASGAELAEDSLRRTRRTPSQAGKDREARVENVKDAFRVVDPARIRHRDIVIVDDVMTTGATLAACAIALRDAGAANVDVLVFARAARDPHETAALALTNGGTILPRPASMAPEKGTRDETG